MLLQYFVSNVEVFTCYSLLKLIEIYLHRTLNQSDELKTYFILNFYNKEHLNYLQVEFQVT